MKNINTKTYWDNRFTSGSWDKNGQKQTTEYAKENIKHINIPANFNGSILDFGCALGDAIPIYRAALLNAKIYGLDISQSAISICKQKYENLATFISGDYKKAPIVDVIICSHVMEHISNDKEVIEALLKKCNNLIVIVPYKESPLFPEHVNYYEKSYYDKFSVIETKTYFVEYEMRLKLTGIIKRLLNGRLKLTRIQKKEMIMYSLKGNLK